MTFSRTVLTNEASANGTGSVPVTLSNSAVISKTLTGLAPTYGGINSSDTILSAFSRVAGDTPTYIGTGSQRIAISPITNIATSIVCESKTAYAVYVGFFITPITVEFVKWMVTVDGTGTDIKEVGIYTSEQGPKGEPHLLKKLVATDVITPGIGVVSNIDNFAKNIDPGSHVWAVIRTAFDASQPEITALTLDRSKGFILAKPSTDSLMVTDSFVAELIDPNIAAQCPALDVYLH